MSKDLVFVVDEYDRPLPPLPRDKVIEEGHWRRTAAIFVVNPDSKQVLCQKRSDKKDERPGVWISMFGGKSDPGETQQRTAIRELEEEVSIKIEPKDLNFVMKFKSNKHHQFEYLYWIRWKGDINNLVFDKEEVSEIGWYDINDVLKNLTENVEGWYCYGAGELALIKRVKKAIKA